MKILVTGANGQLGSEFRTLSIIHNKFDWVFTDICELNLIDLKNLDNNLSKINPDLIINCAAFTNVDKAESEKKIANILNFKSVDLMSKWTSINKSKIIHISTDYVFDGNSSIPLKEDACTSPINVYGKTKLRGELVCKKNDPNCIIIRTSWVYSTYGNNFVKAMSSLMKTKKSLNVINDQIGSPTYARDLAETIIYIINYKDWKYGLYHYSNEGKISWYDFAISIKKYFGYSTELNEISSINYKTQAERPKYSLLDKTKIKTTFGITVPNYENSLKKCIKILNNEK